MGIADYDSNEFWFAPGGETICSGCEGTNNKREECTWKYSATFTVFHEFQCCLQEIG